MSFSVNSPTQNNYSSEDVAKSFLPVDIVNIIFEKLSYKTIETIGLISRSQLIVVNAYWHNIRKFDAYIPQKQLIKLIPRCSYLTTLILQSKDLDENLGKSLLELKYFKTLQIEATSKEAEQGLIICDSPILQQVTGKIETLILNWNNIRMFRQVNISNLASTIKSLQTNIPLKLEIYSKLTTLTTLDTPLITLDLREIRNLAHDYSSVSYFSAGKFLSDTITTLTLRNITSIPSGTQLLQKFFKRHSFSKLCSLTLEFFNLYEKCDLPAALKILRLINCTNQNNVTFPHLPNLSIQKIQNGDIFKNLQAIDCFDEWSPSSWED